MHRPVIAASLLAILGIWAAAAEPAAAQPGKSPPPEPEPEPEPAELAPPASAAARELGARLGAAAGSGVTPGGLKIGGVYLYQLSAVDWFEGGAGFIIGSSGAECFTDRQGEFVCDHGVLSGRSVEISAGVRRFLTAQDAFTPYAHAGVGLRAISYSGDDLSGFAAIVSAGGGVRARVHELLSVGGGAALDVGAAIFGRGLGLEPQIGLSVHVTVEFHLE